MTRSEAHLAHAANHQKLAAEHRAKGNDRKVYLHTQMAAKHFKLALAAC